jgi:formate dehydrogenase iron-sulfur subunit
LEKEDIMAIPHGQRALLIDITRCIGCHACAAACQELHQFPGDGTDAELSATAYTVVLDKGNDRYVRKMCMHCVDPTCASVCPVAAFSKTAQGAVAYDSNRCLGCRYCMVACPFEVPKYEYEKALPTVKKCTFCAARQEKGLLPACASVCPSGALKFGKRGELVAEARRRVYGNPDKYVQHVYGEHEAGGTNWLYISDVDFAKLDMKVTVNDASYPQLVKGVLGVPPFVMTLWPPLLMGFYAFSHRRDEVAGQEGSEHRSQGEGSHE